MASIGRSLAVRFALFAGGGAFVLVVIGLAGLYWQVASSSAPVPRLVVAQLGEAAREAEPLLSGGSDGSTQRWLSGLPQLSRWRLSAGPFFVDIAEGAQFSIAGSAAPPPRECETPPELIESVRSCRLADGSWWVSAALDGGRVLVGHFVVPSHRARFALTLIGVALGSLVPLLVIAGVVGAVLGSLGTRALRRRLRRMQGIAVTWTSGALDARVTDTRDDEIGVLAAAMNEMATHLRRLQGELAAAAVAEERTRLARDLHDGVKQSVFAASLHLSAALQDAAPGTRSRSVLERAAHAIEVAQTDVARMLSEGPSCSSATLDALCRATATTWAMEIDADGEQLSCEGAAGEALFWVAREAINNAAKHAGRGGVRVRWGRVLGCAFVEVTDHGAGFDGSALGRGGRGMPSMQDRAASVGGRLDIDSGSTGTRVRCEVPT